MAREGGKGKVAAPFGISVLNSPRDANLISEAVKRNEFLRCLGDGQSHPLVESFTLEERQPGDTVIAEGDDGHTMYIVAGEGAEGSDEVWDTAPDCWG